MSFLLFAVEMDLHDKEILPGDILPVVIIGKKTHVKNCSFNCSVTNLKGAVISFV